MAESKEICTVQVGQTVAGNAYTFFEDGSVLHSYGRYALDSGGGNWIKVHQLTKQRRKYILKMCAPAHKEELKSLFEKYNHVDGVE